MNKAYSTKALPHGTILREWRLEEVLGVGGFGIVYKGRGIYFNELVAIKEYFPSSISERNEDDTVVPVDSDSEEVHALGLKKFVEEAKLLWNLSTPTRHPNIVNVRSLFEVHGTAYMVMDFEDGVSLSRMLKNGHRFNEASLSNLIKPIAEGLDRAHRVGVLHRDIKPPNILVNEDGKPVLIDFGSARFESGDATSTKVTFYTPPYAAIEQYVKTYEQGPWTDIYALGVVLYQCVTGEKPADVLERLHGGEEARLADGDWPGYSRTFLAAVDAALTIKPAERPQSVTDWLRLFDGEADGADVAALFDDGEATRMVAYSDGPEIVPVAPPPPGFSATGKPPTDVPHDPSAVKFSLAGQDTGAGKKHREAPRRETQAAGVAGQAAQSPANKTGPAGAPPAKPDGGKTASRKRLNPFLVGGAGLALVAATGGWLLFGGGRSPDIDEALLEQGEVTPTAGPTTPIASQGPVQGVTALIAQARQFGAPAAVVSRLASDTDALTRGGEVPAGSEAAAGGQIKAAAARFAAGLQNDAEAKARQLAASVPWASATSANAARAETGNRQAIARNLRASLQALRAASAKTAGAASPEDALEAAHEALVQWRNLAAGTRAAYRVQSVPTPPGLPPEVAPEPGPAAAVAESAAPPAPAAAPAATAGVSGAKRSQFSTVLSRAKGVAREVRRLPLGDRPGSRATDEEKQAYRTRQADRDAARDYERYLDRLEASMRGAKSDSEVDQLISQALQTEDYLRAMLSRN